MKTFFGIQGTLFKFLDVSSGVLEVLRGKPQLILENF